MWGSGYAFGQASAKKDLGTAQAGFDWDNWEVGNPAAAAILDPPHSLEEILRARNIVLKGLRDTTADELGTVLSDSLAGGWDSGKTAKALNEKLDNPKRAMVIARTETARAQVMATQDEYQAEGIKEWTWVVGDPQNCICVSLAGQTAVIGEEFLDEFGIPSGVIAPPAHPNCVCAVTRSESSTLAGSPFNVDPTEFDPESAVDALLMAARAMVRKYDAEQPRDDAGRWTADGENTFSETSGSFGSRLSMHDKTGKELANVRYKKISGDIEIEHIESTVEENKGHATALLERLYESNPESVVHWGKTIVPASTHLAAKFDNKYGRTTYMPWGEGVVDGKEWGVLYGSAAGKSLNLDKYEADQPRDESGKWTSTGMSAVISKVNEKTSALMSAGAKFDSLSTQSAIRDDKAQLNDFKAKLPEGSKYNEGLRMTESALGYNVNLLTEEDGVHAVSLHDANGQLAGAAVTTIEEIDDLKYAELHYLGTTGIVDGAGSALFGDAVKFAAENGVGISLSPLDAEAQDFWKSMGFHAEREGINEWLYLYEEDVQKMAEKLNG